MFYQICADLLVLIHLVFIVFVMTGGFIVMRWSWMALLHIPAAVWGAVVELNGWICILTPWENRLRNLAGQEGYSGGFIDQYIIPLIYPAELSHDMQLIMGVIVILVNFCVYAFILYRLVRKEKHATR